MLWGRHSLWGRLWIALGDMTAQLGLGRSFRQLVGLSVFDD